MIYEVRTMKQMTACIVLGLILTGCVSQQPMGASVASVKLQQTYDLDATQKNKHVVPEGTGEKMQSAYDQYLGKKEDELSSRSSQVLIEFN